MDSQVSNQTPPIFKPEQATEIAVLSQIETTLSEKPPETAIDKGRMSAGRFQIWGSNIVNELKLPSARLMMSQEFLDKWDASWSYKGPDG